MGIEVSDHKDVGPVIGFKEGRKVREVSLGTRGAGGDIYVEDGYGVAREGHQYPLVFQGGVGGEERVGGDGAEGSVMPNQKGEAASSVGGRTVTADQIETGGVKGGRGRGEFGFLNGGNSDLRG